MPKTEQIEPYQFKPGTSGNPGGRPKRRPITDYLIEQLEQPVPDAMLSELDDKARAIMAVVYGDKPTFGQALAFKMVHLSGKGDMFAMREILDRVEGKVTQKMEHSGGIAVLSEKSDDELDERLSELGFAPGVV